MDMASCDIAGASSLVIGILLARALGSSVPADGFPLPIELPWGLPPGSTVKPNVIRTSIDSDVVIDSLRQVDTRC